MSIYAIGDIHLSLTTDKPMEIFGGQWINHTNRIKEKWERIVKETDTVIIPGDISWGLRRQEADEDLAWISRLPGQKVLIRGNHDLWWTSVTKLNQLDSRMYFLQNTHYMAEDYADDPGNDGVVIYLKDVKAMKKLPVGYCVQIEDSWLGELKKKYGDFNVKVVERVLKNF